MPLFGPPNVAKLESKCDIPGLIKALGDEKHAEVRNAAGAALERFGTQRPDAALRAQTVSQLIASLKDKDWRIAWSAKQLLYRMRRGIPDPGLCNTVHEQLVQTEFHNLGSLNAANVRDAVQRLGELGDPRAVERLENVATKQWREERGTGLYRPAAAYILGPPPLFRKQDVDEIRFAAIRALGRHGAPAVKPLLGLLGAWDHTESQAALDALKQAAGPEAVEPLVAALRDTNITVQAGAAEVLAGIRDPRAAQGLIAALGDPAASVRDRAEAALAQLGSPAVQPLLSALVDGNAQVRCSAAQALDRLGWRPDAGPAGAAYWAARGAWDHCAGLGGAAIGPLIALLRVAGPADRQVVAGTMGRIGAPAVEPALAALADPQWQVRAGAAEALGTLADRRAVLPLMETLSDGQWETRKAAAGALVQLYQAGTLDDAQKGLLLQRRPAITAAHEDEPPSHFDRTLEKHEDYQPSSDCTDHTDARAGHTDKPYGHVDEGGIGLALPF